MHTADVDIPIYTVWHKNHISDHMGHDLTAVCIKCGTTCIHMTLTSVDCCVVKFLFRFVFLYNKTTAVSYCVAFPYSEQINLPKRRPAVRAALPLNELQTFQ